MGATKLALNVEQGSDFDLVVTVVGGPASLSGYTGSMQIRAIKSAGETLYTVDPGAIAIDNVGRQVTVSLPWTETADFDWDNGLYDLVITSADQTEQHRLVEGKVSVDHSVTRAA